MRPMERFYNAICVCVCVFVIKDKRRGIPSCELLCRVVLSALGNVENVFDVKESGSVCERVRDRET